MSASLYGLIPAAGSGARFGASTPKQYALLDGEAVLVHAVRALAAHPRIELVFVVLARGDELYERCDWRAFGGRVAPLYCGGATRRDSVFNGLVAIANVVDPDDWMLVHDAARPCLGPAELARLIEQSDADGVGGILAVPVADTLKRGDQEGRIIATESRASLWQAQTPQMFRHGALIEALSRAGEVTDEASALEAMGLYPRLVTGEASNLKLTYAGDLAFAGAWLAARRNA